MNDPALPLALPAYTAARTLSVRRQAVMAAMAISFLWLAATAWLRPLTLPDEGRYAGVALEMLRSGHWAVPTLDGLPFFHKPPLFYWITACAMSVVGQVEWAARFASLLAATLGAGAIYALVYRWSGRRLARLTLLVLLTQPLWFIGAQFADMNMLVAGCISATIALLAHAALKMHDGLPWRRALLAAYAFAALGVLAKGLIGAVIPALVMLVWLAMLKRWRTIMALLWVPGIAVFIAIAAPWFARMQWEFPGFFHYFIVVQHFARFALGGFNNAEPFWFYAAALTVLSLPWVVWLGLALKRGYWQRVSQEPVLALMWAWLAVVVVFFSLPQSKLIGYVLPAVPPLACLIADAAALVRKSRLRATTALATVLCLGVVAGVAWHPLPTHRHMAQALAARRLPSEPVVFIDDYFYDLPFYADLHATPLVVDDWASPEMLMRDNWRHELADAAAFVPRTAANHLIDDAALAARLCAATRLSWVIATDAVAPRYPFLKWAEAIETNNGSTLWRVDRSAPRLARSLGCR